jgi:hypothetical protein
MASNTFITWTIMVVVSASMNFAAATYSNAAGSSVPATTSQKSQGMRRNTRARQCPGCDADVTTSSCGEHAPANPAAAGFQIPYGPGPYRYRGNFGISNANRAIGHSMRSLNNSIRTMNNSINTIRNMNRRLR